MQSNTTQKLVIAGIATVVVGYVLYRYWGTDDTDSPQKPE
jgi:hypothetical protein